MEESKINWRVGIFFTMLLFALILFVCNANADTRSDNTCTTYSDGWGNIKHKNDSCISTTTHENHINFHTCTVKVKHICIDNSCHNDECSCSACYADANNIMLGWIIGCLVGFMLLILTIYAIQNNMFNTKLRY